jgi:hypothetical protein
LTKRFPHNPIYSLDTAETGATLDSIFDTHFLLEEQMKTPKVKIIHLQRDLSGRVIKEQEYDSDYFDVFYSVRKTGTFRIEQLPVRIENIRVIEVPDTSKPEHPAPGKKQLHVLKVRSELIDSVNGLIDNGLTQDEIEWIKDKFSATKTERIEEPNA